MGLKVIVIPLVQARLVELLVALFFIIVLLTRGALGALVTFVFAFVIKGRLIHGTKVPSSALVSWSLESGTRPFSLGIVDVGALFLARISLAALYSSVRFLLFFVLVSLV